MDLGRQELRLSGGDDLWALDGRHVRRFVGDEVLAADGTYLGEMMGTNRLNTRQAKLG